VISNKAILKVVCYRDIKQGYLKGYFYRDIKQGYLKGYLLS